MQNILSFALSSQHNSYGWAERPGHETRRAGQLHIPRAAAIPILHAAHLLGLGLRLGLGGVIPFFQVRQSATPEQSQL